MARILVIEDNPINLELMSYLLAAWGHEVATAGDGDTGLAAVREQRPELVVCDIQMPGTDGYTVARTLKADAVLRHIPLVAVTAYAMVGDQDRALQAGFDAHFPKPIDPAVFMAAIAPFLRETQSAPRHSAAPSPPQPGALPIDDALMAPRPGLTLLLVDDTEANLDYKLSLLEPAGYRVLTAGGGDEALAIARREHVDLIVSDAVMASGNGIELLARVRIDRALRATPFLFLTATARDSASRARALSLGADDYLLRPIEPERLLAAIRALLVG